MTRGRKAFTAERLREMLAEIERKPYKSKKELLRMGRFRRMLGIYKYSTSQSKNNKLTIINVKDYIRTGKARGFFNE